MQHKHNRNLDILRGIAALLVMLFHLINVDRRDFDKNFDISYLKDFRFPGHIGVLVFFILSGYVISINTKRLTDRGSIFTYLGKRLIRILPIYFAAILFTVAITFGQYDWRIILSNFFFISVPLDNVILENGPLWSLNYELLYYFVFIFFSYYNISFVKTVKGLLVIIAAMFVFFHKVMIHPLIISYLVGFLFWSAGAMLGEVRDWSYWKVNFSRVLSVFLLIFCLQPLNPFGPVLKLLKITMVDYSAYSFPQAAITYADVYYLPFAILLILSLTHAYSKRYPYLLYFIFISAVVRVAILFKVYNLDFIVKEHLIAPIIILILSILLWFSNFDIGGKVKRLFIASSSLGSISYAIYIIHVPLIFLFGMIAATSGLMFAGKLLAYLIALLLASYFLEHNYQSFVKKMLRRKRPPSATINIKDRTN
jgi:peptidoglycan/LPS O-acetylase OafA/YrhL